MNAHPNSITDWIWSIICVCLIGASFSVGILNAAMDCRRDIPQNCIVVQHVWEVF